MFVHKYKLGKQHKNLKNYVGNMWVCGQPKPLHFIKGVI